MKKNYSIILLVCLSLFGYTNLLAQNSSTTQYRIGFVKSISNENISTERGFFQKVSDFILGKSNIKIKKPVAVVKDEDQNLLILDQGLFNILKTDKNGNGLETFDTDFYSPSLIDICKFNNLFLFTDSKSNTIYSLDDNEINIFSTNTVLDQPTGICYLQSTNQIWVSETGKHSISIFDENGKYLKRVGKRGIEKSEFNFPTSICHDKEDNVYIVDAMNFRIQIFDKNGNFISMFGKQGDATGNFARPKGIAIDGYNNIYVVDGLFHTVQIFNKNGEFLYNFGTQGKTENRFWLPHGIYIDEENFIYVADSYNSRIQVYKLIEN